MAAVEASFGAAVGTAVMAVSWRTFCAVVEAIRILDNDGGSVWCTGCNVN